MSQLIVYFIHRTHSWYITQMATLTMHQQTILFNLCRSRAQALVFDLLLGHDNSYKMLVDQTLELLSSEKTQEEVSHEELKGALYILMGSNTINTSTILREDWENMLKIWPALVASRYVLHILVNIAKCDFFQNVITDTAINQALQSSFKISITVLMTMSTPLE